jgi:hypothetical protein
MRRTQRITAYDGDAQRVLGYLRQIRNAKQPDADFLSEEDRRRQREYEARLREQEATRR